MNIQQMDEVVGVRDKRERFVALAEARTEKALNSLRLLGNLSNRANYEYSDADVEQILRAIKAEVKAVEAKFRSNGPVDSGFKLKK